MNFGLGENLIILIYDPVGQLLLFMILIANLASWVLEAKSISVLDTLNTLRSLTNKHMEVFLN